MPNNSNRPKRVAKLIQHELTLLLRHEAKDPRFNAVTITEVDVSPDLKNAKIYFTLLDELKKEETQKALNKAAGYLRRELAPILQLRVVPQLFFHYDDSLIRAEKISKLLKDSD